MEKETSNIPAFPHTEAVLDIAVVMQDDSILGGSFPHRFTEDMNEEGC